MLRIRKTKTGSGNIAVQVVLSGGHKVKVIKHIGTGRSEKEVKKLVKAAKSYIDHNPFFPSLFACSSGKKEPETVLVSNLVALGSLHTFSYEILSYWYEKSGFGAIDFPLLKDLSIIRIIKPASKFKSIKLLKKYFNIKYTRKVLYERLEKMPAFKKEAETTAVNYAKSNYDFDFSLIFYDVTTLYFETFKDDDFRKPGFSKDNKPQQPQIVVGLVVNSQGYPIAYDLFKGNTFEGHTFIPTILRVKEKYKIKNLTVVADAAMLCFANMQKIAQNGLKYIVGARVGNLPYLQIKTVSESLNKKEGKYYQGKTKNGILICSYSKKRASKNKSDRKKQLKKAKYQIQNPASVTRRSKFLKTKSKHKYTLNSKLVKKSKLLDGIKGYYTNLDKPNPLIIENQYKSLWNIEKSFRIAKSDLNARPVFARKEASIKAHCLIVFISLCISKAIEIKTKTSIQKIKDLIWPITDIKLKDKLTEKTFIRRLEYVENTIIKALMS